MEKQKTIFQKLNGIFGYNSNISNSNAINSEPSREILKADSKEEFLTKTLEVQQQSYIDGHFNKATSDSYQKTLQVEPTRILAYRDFEDMEYYPIIASALDLFTEEATTIGDNGKMLNVYSNSDRIKTILQDFFYGTLDINTNLPHWTRNLTKYGDNFVYMHPKVGKGIIEVKQLTNLDIERIEKIETNGKSILKFKNKLLNDEYNPFQIAHFRLLGDDKYLPYGSSSLNKVRRTFRQLVMAEDSMLTYRLSRAAERRVFKINVGNIDDKDIEPYMQKAASKFKKSSHVNKANGNTDFRYNSMSVDEDFFIPVRSENAGTVIDTLPGAQNMDQISDITYLRDNLFTGLGIPKSFLGFEEAVGGGKNMAMEDVRFAKKVNRIQQALIQELNKMATIHLYLLGFEDDMSNFTLSLTNPSIQGDILKIEALDKKINVYERLVKPDDTGIAPMSMTRAKKELFGWSNNEIIEDLKQQRLERVVGEELKASPNVIASSGIFKEMDNKYSKIIVPKDGNSSGTTQTDTVGSDNQNGGNEQPFSLDTNTGGENKEPEVEESLLYKSSVLTEEANRMISSIDEYLKKDKITSKKRKSKD